MSLRRSIDKLISRATASYKGFRVGETVINTNKKCLHFGSIGEVVKIEALPDNSGYLIHYKVSNSGFTFAPGDILKKTEDQLELYKGL